MAIGRWAILAATGFLIAVPSALRASPAGGASFVNSQFGIAVGTRAPRASNPIVIENQHAGSDKWQLGAPGFTIADDTHKQIKGYASATSVNKGESLSLFVSVNPAQTYTIDVYRMGWYNGLRGRLLRHRGPLTGIRQPACPVAATTGLMACHWAPSYRFTVPSTWTSGIFLAVLTNAHHYQNYIIFAVRDDGRKAALLFQQSVTTYQAYNNYPDDKKTGKSLYDYNSSGATTIAGSAAAVKVSFDRPYADDGSGEFLDRDIDAVQWLERSGYDVSYSTDIDTHANGNRLLDHKGFLSVGHDEYWSQAMYNAVQKARDSGVNLAFLGADEVTWQIRFEPSAGGVPNRVEVCYRRASIDPVHGPTTTVQWRDPLIHRPQQSLVGLDSDNQLKGDINVPYTVINSAHWVYTGTGFRRGSSVPKLVGYEVDYYNPSFPPPSNTSYTLLSRSPVTLVTNQPSHANSSIYRAPSGAWVFAAGTISWSEGLANYYHRYADPRIQQVTANILHTFLTDHTFISGGIPSAACKVQPVSWTNAVNVRITGNTLQKTDRHYTWNAGAVSTATLGSGNGSVQVTADSTSYGRMFGLTHGRPGTAYQHLTYGLDLQSDGGLSIYESGVYRHNSGIYAVGDVLKVAVEYGVVQYYRNGTLLYTSTVAPTYPLVFDGVIRDPGGRLTNAGWCR